MRALVQRVKSSSVLVDGKTVGEIGAGLNVLVGFCAEDTDASLDYIIRKIINLRIFEDQDGKMNRSVADISGELLIVSQFTLYADTKKGNRPSFIRAAEYETGEILYRSFLKKLDATGIRYSTGIYGADMQVTIVNDGPVTILIDSER